VVRREAVAICTTFVQIVAGVFVVVLVVRFRSFYLCWFSLFRGGLVRSAPPFPRRWCCFACLGMFYIYGVRFRSTRSSIVGLFETGTAVLCRRWGWLWFVFRFSISGFAWSRSVLLIFKTSPLLLSCWCFASQMWFVVIGFVWLERAFILVCFTRVVGSCSCPCWRQFISHSSKDEFESFQAYLCLCW
jgi:hypothetical protein